MISLELEHIVHPVAARYVEFFHRRYVAVGEKRGTLRIWSGACIEASQKLNDATCIYMLKILKMGCFFTMDLPWKTPKKQVKIRFCD